ncbi:MAG: gamma-glutamylcyclotransferase family protein [Candidatus Lernaella stagnicola]|nr:gamma-glutamylcyclotransferase family protein [Candidatus Lernaella stagnicola]
MFVARFFDGRNVVVFHPPELIVSFDDLLEHQLLFVWDELMDPHQVFEQIGRYPPFAPATLPDHARVVEREGEARVYRLIDSEGQLANGFVLLGLSDSEMDVFDQFEQVPIHRVRHTCRVRIGDLERVAAVHSGVGSYLGDAD